MSFEDKIREERNEAFRALENCWGEAYLLGIGQRHKYDACKEIIKEARRPLENSVLELPLDQDLPLSEAS